MLNQSNFHGLGRRVQVRSGYYYTPTYPWDNYSFNKEGYCASIESDGKMCVEFDDGSQQWFSIEDVKFIG